MNERKNEWKKIEEKKKKNEKNDWTEKFRFYGPEVGHSRVTAHLR
jgi:hypothetical protein